MDGRAETVDAHRPLPGDCTLSILTKRDDNDDSLNLLRHSTAHVMAEAVCKLFPTAKLVYGPPVEDGFYYDIDLDEPITTGHFEQIEAEMARIVKEDRPFTRYELPREQGMEKLLAEGNQYKVDNAERAEGDTLSFYVTGEHVAGEHVAGGECDAHFEDLCRGPHVPSTGYIGAFMVRQVSAAYYRGDAKLKSLQRVYGTAYFKKKSLKEYIHRMEEAVKRDHRTIGRHLDLFHIDEMVGQGLVLWTPAGATIRKQLQNFISEELRKQGYQEVFTPHIGKLDLYRTSGHVPYYEDSQFPVLLPVRENAKPLVALLRNARNENALPDADEERRLVSEAGILETEYPWDEQNPLHRYGAARQLALEGTEHSCCADIAHHCSTHGDDGFLLRPMNCPHHIRIFSSRPRSYRDLPIRLSEFGTVYRWEQTGQLNGLTRVRGFTQDDAHLFCMPDQVAGELQGCLELVKVIFNTLGMTDYRVRVGLRDPGSDKYIGDPKNWEKAEEACREAARSMDVPFSEEIGEAAFYGPKIDFVVKDCIGREWQLGTVQVDYNLPTRFKLAYIGNDNKEHTPVMIHRAPFGSMERFCGILIEHFAGLFPLWLSPVQVMVLAISDKSSDYADRVYRRLMSAGVRVEIDHASEKIGPKKHKARARRIPYILVVGEREAQDETVNVNDAEGQTLGTVSLDKFVDDCIQEIVNKSLSNKDLDVPSAALA